MRVAEWFCHSGVKRNKAARQRPCWPWTRVHHADEATAWRYAGAGISGRRLATEAAVLLLHLQRWSDSPLTRAITITDSTPSRRSFAAENERQAGRIETPERALHALRADRVTLAGEIEHMNGTRACGSGSPAAGARIRRAGKFRRRGGGDAATECPVGTTGESSALSGPGMPHWRRLQRPRLRVRLEVDIVTRHPMGASLDDVDGRKCRHVA